MWPIVRRPGRGHGRGRGGLRWSCPFLVSAAPSRLPRPTPHGALASDPLPDPLPERRSRSFRAHRALAREDQAHPERAARDIQRPGARTARGSRPGAGRRDRFLEQEHQVTASQHMVQANGLRFRTMVDGPAGGEMVILLHGFPEGAESWSKQVDALARSGALAVAPDMRGYGLSDAPGSVEDYRLDKLVEDVAGIIKAFGRSSAHVAGHDWGAMVAWYFAGLHPEMTKTLTVLSVGHPSALAEAAAQDQDQTERSRYIGLFLTEGKAESVLSEDDYRRVRG